MIVNKFSKVQKVGSASLIVQPINNLQVVGSAPFGPECPVPKGLFWQCPELITEIPVQDFQHPVIGSCFIVLLQDFQGHHLGPPVVGLAPLQTLHIGMICAVAEVSFSGCRRNHGLNPPARFCLKFLVIKKVIEALAAAVPSLIVVNISGSPVAMPWADKVDAIVQGWYGGSESGHALADVLTGAVNPSGRLPFTFPRSVADGPLKTDRQYPGIQEEGKKWWQEYYDEGVFVGYRWYASQGIPVQFPFGHGLSYTTFRYDGARLSKSSVKCSGNFDTESGGDTVLTASVNISNTGDRDGAEVVQVYIAPPAGGAERPVKELRGFEKVAIKAGESARVSVSLPRRAFSRFDAQAHRWVVDPGTWTVLIGSSSEDIRCSLPVVIR